MSTYTVRQATATGKTDPTYGDEYIVHFEEDDREVKLSRKKPVVPGQTEDGTIVAGKYGAYFKKAPRDFAAPKATGGASTPVTGKPAPSYARKDNSDGQRQGMCINNAALYVNATTAAGDKPLTEQEWAKLVHGYASALYSLGDLHQTVALEGNPFA
jgi:hypothetical protein